MALGILLLPGQGWTGDNDTELSTQEEATASPAGLFGYGKKEFAITAGYGFTIPVGGRTDDMEDLEYVFVAPRFGIGISDPLGGDAWYRGNFELLVEAPLLFAFEPRSGKAGGGSLLLRYNFLPEGKFIPFIESGAGVMIIDFDLEGQSDGFNFSLQGGLGFHYFFQEQTALTGGWRWLHISNAGISLPNQGIDSNVFLVGVSFFLE
jgi:opacity protein-like surface antigen